MVEYDFNYYKKMQRKNSGTAERINNVRWELIKSYVPKVKTVLDYGSGCGYLTAFAPEGVEVDSYDIGKYYDGIPYPQTGILKGHYDAICLYDVIEHVDWAVKSDALMLSMIRASTYVFVSVPIFPGDAIAHKSSTFPFHDPPLFTGNDIIQWRHYRPGEHLTYFTEESLTALLKALGYELLYKGYDECPPRLDIMTFVFSGVSGNVSKENNSVARSESW